MLSVMKPAWFAAAHMQDNCTMLIQHSAFSMDQMRPTPCIKAGGDCVAEGNTAGQVECYQWQNAAEGFLNFVAYGNSGRCMDAVHVRPFDKYIVNEKRDGVESGRTGPLPSPPQL